MKRTRSAPSVNSEPEPVSAVPTPGNGEASTEFPYGENAEPTSAGKTPQEPAPTRLLIAGIDLDGVALEEDYQGATSADDKPATVVVRKPSGQGFFRAHPTLWRNVRMMEVKNGPDRGFYLVAAAAKTYLQAAENEDVKLFPARLTLCFSRDTGLFLWPLRLPEPRKDNQIDEWSQSALRVAKLAETQWVKLYTHKGGNCYSFRLGEGIKAEPPWPTFSLNDAAGMAFEGRHLTDPHDPLIRRLLGKE
jgi:hypothetical protein